MLRVYDISLQWVLRHRPATMVSFVLVLAATLYLFVKIPKGFVPDQDTDQILAVTEAAQGTSYFEMVQYQKAIAEVIREDPNVESLVSSVGGASASTLGGPNFGQLVVHLKPRSRRALLVDDIIEGLRPKLSQFPGMRVYLQNPPTIRIGGQVTKSVYQFSLQAQDKWQLYAEAEKLQKAIATVPGLQDVTTDVAVQSPQVNVTIDR